MKLQGKYDEAEKEAREALVEIDQEHPDYARIIDRLCELLIVQVLVSPFAPKILKK